MRRQITLILGVVLCVPALAQAITITAGDYLLAPNTTGQQIDILLSGAGGSDFYSATDTRMLIGGGTSGPRVTHVFGDTTTVINPAASLMSGSIWASQGTAQGGIALFPDGTYPTNSGRQTVTFFGTNGLANTTANGIYATLTVSTVGVAPGEYSFDLTGHPNGPTQLFFSIFDGEELVDTGEIPDVILVNGTLTVTPEPTSMVIGLSAVAAFAVIAVQRRRARNAR